MSRKLVRALARWLIGLATAVPGMLRGAGPDAPPAAVFTLPAGFSAVRVAAAPLTRYPMLIGLDDRGRLFVAESAGLNLNDKELLAQLPGQVRMLEDTDGDGTFDRSTVFADKLTYPEGVLWHEGALYVASPPSIWKLEDTDGDGRADRRTEVATGFGFNGNAADVHGPWLHPDGRLYWPHARKPHEIFRPDGSLLSRGTGARIWTSRLDGSDLRVHAGGGMDNPTGMAITPEGDILCTANIVHSGPRQDAVVHFVHGGVYPRADQVKTLAEFRSTGELLSAAALLGHVAIAGMTLAQAPSWPEAWRGTAFAVEFNTRRILRLSFRREGATIRGTPEVFGSVQGDTGVHLTDVIEDADGSLLVVDTGGWLRNGCPTSGAARAEVFGGIYRIRRAGAPAIADPRGHAIAWSDLAPEDFGPLLGDGRPLVRQRALAEAARRSTPAALARVLDRPDAEARINALWALTRQGTPAAQAVTRRGLADADARVRQVAATSAFTTADAGARSGLVAALRDPDLAVRREAARALGRLRQADTVPLLAAAIRHAPGDAFLLHALIYALIEIGEPGPVARLLEDADAAVRRAALLALDQIPGGASPAAAAFRALDATDARLRAAALDLVTRRPEWGAEAAGYLARAEPGADVLARLLPVHLRTPAVRDWLRPRLGSLPAAVVCHALADAGPEAWDPAWKDYLANALQSPDLAVAQAALRAVNVHRDRNFAAVLGIVAADASRPASFRVGVLQAAAGPAQTLPTPSFTLLMSPFVQGGTVESRVQAANVLASVRLTRDQCLELLRFVAPAGPLELPPLLRAFTRGPVDPEIARRLLDALRRAPARFGLNTPEVLGVFRRQGREHEEAAALIVREILDHAASRGSRVGEIAALAERGDPARGRAAFLAGTGGCVACHRVGEAGARVGPDLSHIGAVRNARDLAESIAFPAASIVRGYETFIVRLKDGSALSGVIPRETGDALVLGSADGQEQIVPRDRIATVEPVADSVMPAGLDQAMSPADLGDLVAYLVSLK